MTTPRLLRRLAAPVTTLMSVDTLPPTSAVDRPRLTDLRGSDRVEDVEIGHTSGFARRGELGPPVAVEVGDRRQDVFRVEEESVRTRVAVADLASAIREVDGAIRPDVRPPIAVLIADVPDALADGVEGIAVLVGLSGLADPGRGAHRRRIRDPSAAIGVVDSQSEIAAPIAILIAQRRGRLEPTGLARVLASSDLERASLRHGIGQIDVLAGRRSLDAVSGRTRVALLSLPATIRVRSPRSPTKV